MSNENSSEFKGIVNPEMTPAKKAIHPPEYYLEGLQNSHTGILAEAITLVESTGQKYFEVKREILNRITRHNHHTVRIGITGAPGAGKSTFIEVLGEHIIASGKKLAVLTLDPASPVSRGSLLGDKTRMAELSRKGMAYIRPGPATPGKSIGKSTLDSIFLCEAAGFDTIMVETVGVGQADTEVDLLVDVFLLLVGPGAGDEVQGLKRGIIEMADLLVFTKADGNFEEVAKKTLSQYKNALRILSGRRPDWKAEAVLVSSFEKKGIDTVWSTIEKFIDIRKKNDAFSRHRVSQLKSWFARRLRDQIEERLLGNDEIRAMIGRMEKAITTYELNATIAAQTVAESVLTGEKK
jgi:LAO/AO transport system kinase